MTHLTSPYASAFDVPILGAIVSLAVQFFFAYRIWLLGNKKHWWFSGIICVVSPLCRIRLLEVLIIFQISSVDASAAFAGGIYVSLSFHAKSSLAQE